MNFLLMLPGAFLAPILHEWVKAMVSRALGDPVPKNSGFLSWNPLKYFEPIGFILMLSVGVGWGRPVPTSPLYYKDRRMGTILTYTAPIVANLLVGMLVAFIWRVVFMDAVFWWGQNMLYNTGATWPITWALYLSIAIRLFAQMNIGLAVFSLIPVFPLAGSKILQLFASSETNMRMMHNEKMMQFILMITLMFGVLQMLIFPIRDFILNLVWM